MIKKIAVVLLNIGVMTTAGNLAGCCHNDPGNPEKGQSMPERSIENVQEEYTDGWMAIPGVEGTAIGLSEGKPCIKIFTSSKSQQLRRNIPSTIEGYPVVIEQTGTFQALEDQ